MIGLGLIVALAGAAPSIDSRSSETPKVERLDLNNSRVVPYEDHPAASIIDTDTRKLLATSHIPEFGGAFVNAETETLHVWLTEPTKELGQEVYAALARTVGAGALSSKDVVVHRADYTFAQLKAWKDAAMELFAMPEVVLLGISQHTNRLRIGVRGQDRLPQAIAETLASLGIPSAATFVVSVDRPFTQQLRDEHRPLTGGTQIQFQTGFGGLDTATCTMGFPASRNGVPGFVTNAHCSRTQGDVDDGRYWQATRPLNQTNQVGTEIVDPPFFVGGPCPPESV